MYVLVRVIGIGIIDVVGYQSGSSVRVRVVVPVTPSPERSTAKDQRTVKRV